MYASILCKKESIDLIYNKDHFSTKRLNSHENNL